MHVFACTSCRHLSNNAGETLLHVASNTVLARTPDLHQPASYDAPLHFHMQPSTKLKSGVVHGQDLLDLMEHAQVCAVHWTVSEARLTACGNSYGSAAKAPPVKSRRLSRQGPLALSGTGGAQASSNGN